MGRNKSQVDRRNNSKPKMNRQPGLESRYSQMKKRSDSRESHS